MIGLKVSGKTCDTETGTLWDSSSRIRGREVERCESKAVVVAVGQGFPPLLPFFSLLVVWIRGGRERACEFGGVAATRERASTGVGWWSRRGTRTSPEFSSPYFHPPVVDALLSEVENRIRERDSSDEQEIEGEIKSWIEWLGVLTPCTTVGASSERLQFEVSVEILPSSLSLCISNPITYIGEEIYSYYETKSLSSACSFYEFGIGFLKDILGWFWVDKS